MQTLNGLHIAIASGSEQVQQYLQKAFIKLGADVSLCGFLNGDFVRQLEHGISANVILIDMNDSYDEDEDALDLLLDRIDLPILFHDSDSYDINEPKQCCSFSEKTIDKLAHKLAELVDKSELLVHKEPSAVDKEPSAIDKKPSAGNEPSLSKPPLVRQKSVAVPILEAKSGDDLVLLSLPDEPPENILNVWVLGASIGGPEAVKRFLSKVPAELPVAFVLAQHLGDGFVSLLAHQLDRASRFKVKEALAGDTLKHGEVIVVPVENRMTLNKAGRIEFVDEQWQGYYKPSIDCVIDEVTSSFGTTSGVIIFSGMGADGVLASKQFAEKYQGLIWAQTPDTCVISSMPDSVREQNLVSYSGSPEALAFKLSMHYKVRLS